MTTTHKLIILLCFLKFTRFRLFCAKSSTILFFLTDTDSLYYWLPLNGSNSTIRNRCIFQSLNYAYRSLLCSYLRIFIVCSLPLKMSSALNFLAVIFHSLLSNPSSTLRLLSSFKLRQRKKCGNLSSLFTLFRSIYRRIFGCKYRPSMVH